MILFAIQLALNQSTTHQRDQSSGNAELMRMIRSAKEATRYVSSAQPVIYWATVTVHSLPSRWFEWDDIWQLSIGCHWLKATARRLTAPIKSLAHGRDLWVQCLRMSAKYRDQAWPACFSMLARGCSPSCRDRKESSHKGNANKSLETQHLISPIKWAKIRSDERALIVDSCINERVRLSFH